jgi:hypothetical protein
MSKLPAARDRFARLFPTATPAELTSRIELDILTNYADLWICGEGVVADGLAALKDPATIYAALLTLNEVRTYPLLFGLGGTANYSVANFKEEAPLMEPFGRKLKPRGAPLPESLDMLLRGIRIDVRQLRAADLIALHASGDAERLRTAVRLFEDEAALLSASKGIPSDDFIESAVVLEDRLQDVAREILNPTTQRSMDKTDRAVGYTLKAGVPAVGAVLGTIAGGPEGAIVGLGIGKTVETLLPELARSRLSELAIGKRFSPGLANLWRVMTHRSP